MEQIAVESNYFNVLPSGGWLPNFTGTFFIDSNGKISLNHEFLQLNSANLSQWNYLGKSKKEKNYSIPIKFLSGRIVVYGSTMVSMKLTPTGIHIF